MRDRSQFIGPAMGVGVPKATRACPIDYPVSRIPWREIARHLRRLATLALNCRDPKSLDLSKTCDRLAT